MLSDENTLVSVSQSASVEEAITAMLLNDFSQLAVLTNPRTLHGAVSWKSIAQAQHANPNASFSSMIVPAQVFDYNVRLLRALDTLQREEFIFVRDFDRKISGIITAADGVMHLNPDPVKAADVHRLRHFLDLIRTFNE